MNTSKQVRLGKRHPLKRITGLLAALCAAAGLLAAPAALAEYGHPPYDHYGYHHGYYGYHHGYYRPRPEYRAWRGGHWYHGWHGNRFGWWWLVGGAYVFYSAPVYPYPPVVVEPETPPPDATAPQQYWYYCRHPSGYYPYVARCPGGWRLVPATPSSP